MLEAVQYPNLDEESVRGVGSPLSYSSEELRNDREVVLWAIWHSADAYRFASEELRMDATVYVSAVTSAANHATEIDPTYVPNQLFEDSNRFYQL